MWKDFEHPIKSVLDLYMPNNLMYLFFDINNYTLTPSRAEVKERVELYLYSTLSLHELF
jgi:hypothetical protein